MSSQLTYPIEPVPAFTASALATAALLLQRRLALPRDRVGTQLHFADGTTSRVYRETVMVNEPCAEPAVLVVQFLLKGIGQNPVMHALFRAESLLNTPLFAGFPGFRSKLWCTDRETGVYRGIYQWDVADRARGYAETLLKLLNLVSVRGSLKYHVIPGARRDEFLANPGTVTEREGPDPAGTWWQLRDKST